MTTPQEQEDGGQAYPQGNIFVSDPQTVNLGPRGGMSLRDYFCGQALVGLARLDYGAEEAARRALLYADAMLKARSAK